VAIKLIRNNDVMRKAAAKEISLLREVTKGDPENKRHCVRLEASFEHRGHTAMVFECSAMNLRETLKKFGKVRRIKKTQSSTRPHPKRAHTTARCGHGQVEKPNEHAQRWCWSLCE
jgi:hypothetical protein